jgi:hypothetical protein
MQTDFIEPSVYAFLLAYINYTMGFHCDISNVHKIKFISSITFSYSPSHPCLNNFLTGFIILFSRIEVFNHRQFQLQYFDSRYNLKHFV